MKLQMRMEQRERKKRFAAKFVWAAALPALAFGALCWSQQADAVRDLSVREAIQTALAHRQELKAAAARADAALGMRKQAGAIPNPRAIYQSENLRPNMDFAANVDTYAFVGQPLEVSGRRGARIDVAKRGVEQATLNAEMQKRDIELAVSQAYWDALRLAYLRGLAEESEGFYREMLQYHQRRFDEGKLAAVDLMRIQLEYARAQTRTGSSRLVEMQAMQRLAQEMGLPAAEDWKLSEKFEVLNEARPEALADNAAEGRLEVRQAQQAVEAARANLMLQKAQGRPDLEAVFGYKRAQDHNTMLAGMQMNLPLFDRNRGAVGAAGAEMLASRASLAATELQSESLLKLARTAYLTWKREVTELYAPMVQRSREIAQISQSAYREGGLDLLRLLDSERVRVETQTAWADALGNYHQSVLSLEFAAGLEP